MYGGSPKHPIFSGSTFGLISGDKPLFTAQVEGGHEALGNVLNQMGLHYEETSGRYKEPERSYIVHNPSLDQMRQLGKLFGQESVVHSQNGHHKLVFTNGEHEGKYHQADHQTPIEHFEQPPADEYTMVPGHGYVRINFNWKQLHDLDPMQKGDVIDFKPPQADGKKKRRNAEVVQIPTDANSRWEAPGDPDHNKLVDPIARNKAIAGAVPNFEEPKLAAQGIGRTKNVYDYTHLLDPIAQQNGNTLVIHHMPGKWDDYMTAEVKNKLGQTTNTTWAYPRTLNAGKPQNEAERAMAAALQNHKAWILYGGQTQKSEKEYTPEEAAVFLKAETARLKKAWEAPLGEMPSAVRSKPHPHAYEWHDGHTIHHTEDLAAPKLPGHDLQKADNPQAMQTRGGDSYKQVALPYGNVTPGQKTDLLHYPYQNKLPEIEKLVHDHGFKAYYAGGKYGKPDLANKNYNTGHLMIYDPTPASGGDFGHETYTKGWRQIHELAHALTYPELNKIYGEGRRIGKLGTHRTLNEALRAVHWEWLAAHKQRELSRQVGVDLPDEKFHRELNTVMHDAVHRAINGQFTEPSEEGFQPHGRKVPLHTALQMVRDHANKIGLQGLHSTLKGQPMGKALPGPTNLQSPAAAGVTRAPQLHNTVEGFMGGLKALPRGPERGKFITSHMNHGPFLSALQSHPQGPQIHAMLTQHLNSTRNAGLGVGAKATVKAELEKAWPKDAKQNIENAQGFANTPVTQDLHMEAGLHTPQEHPAQPLNVMPSVPGVSHAEHVSVANVDPRLLQTHARVDESNSNPDYGAEPRGWNRCRNCGTSYDMQHPAATLCPDCDDTEDSSNLDVLAAPSQEPAEPWNSSWTGSKSDARADKNFWGKVNKESGRQSLGPVDFSNIELRSPILKRRVKKSEGLEKANPPQPVNAVLADELQDQGFQPTKGYASRRGGLGAPKDTVKLAAPQRGAAYPGETYGEFTARKEDRGNELLREMSSLRTRREGEPGLLGPWKAVDHPHFGRLYMNPDLSDISDYQAVRFHPYGLSQVVKVGGRAESNVPISHWGPTLARIGLSQADAERESAEAYRRYYNKPPPKNFFSGERRNAVPEPTKPESAPVLGVPEPNREYWAQKTKKSEAIFPSVEGVDPVSEKTYSVEEASALLLKATREKVAEFERGIQTLRERELKKAIVPPHKHNQGMQAAAAAEDVPPGKANPKGLDKADGGSTSPGQHALPPPGTAMAMGEKCEKCQMAKAMCKCMDKADLVAENGKRTDNHTVPGAKLPGKSKLINEGTAKNPGSGGIKLPGANLKKAENNRHGNMKAGDEVKAGALKTKVVHHEDHPNGHYHVEDHGAGVHGVFFTGKRARKPQYVATADGVEGAKKRIANHVKQATETKKSFRDTSAPSQPQPDSEPEAKCDQCGSTKGVKGGLCGSCADKMDTKKAEPLSKPPVSEAQRRAMGAAAGGKSTLGIPKKVGKEFIDADKGGKLPAKKNELEKGIMSDIARQNSPPVPGKPAAAPVKLPSPGQHEDRQAQFAAFTPPPTAGHQPSAAPKPALPKPAVGLASPKAAGVTRSAGPVMNAARPAPAAKPGIFGKLFGKG